MLTGWRAGDTLGVPGLSHVCAHLPEDLVSDRVRQGEDPTLIRLGQSSADHDVRRALPGHGDLAGTAAGDVVESPVMESLRTVRGPVADRFPPCSDGRAVGGLRWAPEGRCEKGCGVRQFCR